MTLFFCGGFIKKMQQKEQARKEREISEDGQSQTSDETIDIAIAYKKKENKQTKY